VIEYVNPTFCEATRYASGEALKLMRDAAEINHCYDLALIDYSMPGMDGIELAQTIRRDG
jgi:CheY-like chemotaxis protein